MTTKCKTNRCTQPADEDIASQGFCLRCVSLLLQGIDPDLLLIHENHISQHHDLLNTLKLILGTADKRRNFGRAEPSHLWRDEAHYLNYLLGKVEEIATEAINKAQP